MSKQIILFCYNELAEQDQTFIKQETERIKSLMTRSVNDIIKIGRSLIEVKSRLEHGQFGAWLETEFEMTDRTARNFMNVAMQFKTETVSDLRIATSALYLLASPNTPEEARENALDMAKAGERVTKAKAKAIINEHKSPPPVVPTIETQRGIYQQPELAPPAQPEIIASAPLASAPKKPEEPSQARCKNAECDGFGLEWSRSDQYGVGLYCLNCIKVNKAAERALLEQLKNGEIEEAFVIDRLGCSKQTLEDKMEAQFGANWRIPAPAPAARMPVPTVSAANIPAPVARVSVPVPTASVANIPPPVGEKPSPAPNITASLRISPDGNITVTVGNGSGGLIWKTGEFAEYQAVLSNGLKEFFNQQGEKYEELFV